MVASSAVGRDLYQSDRIYQRGVELFVTYNRVSCAAGRKPSLECDKPSLATVIVASYASSQHLNYMFMVYFFVHDCEKKLP